MRPLPLLAAAACLLPAQSWTPLVDKNLSQWESIGDGVWTVMRDGTLLGQRAPKAEHQAWLYTKRDYANFDLEFEYWTRLGGNSGVSLRDHTRARWAHGAEWDRTRTPSHHGYEIQIAMGVKNDAYPSGSIYLFAKAKPGVQIENDWNRMEISSRADEIRVRLNGVEVCRHPGDPARPKSGPIGLQLHDPASAVMFRGLRIREVR